MRPTDLARLVLLADPQWHPDGDRLALTEIRLDVEEDRYRSRIMLYDDEVRPLTQGPGDGRPRWAPDGRALAFLRRSPHGDANQVAVLPADGGDARVVTDLARGVRDLAWSPDGSRLLVVGAEWTAELAGLSEAERRRRPRRLTHLRYRIDGAGWVHERRQQLWLVDPGSDGDAAMRLTDLPGDVAAPAWHPKGHRVAAVTRAYEDDGPHDEIVVVDVPSRTVYWTGAIGAWEWVGYGLDGTLYAAGLRDPFHWPDVRRLWCIDCDDDGRAVDLFDLTGHLDRDVLALGPALEPPTPQVAAGGIFVCLEETGRSQLARIDEPARQNVEVTEVFGGDRMVTGFGVHPDGETLAVVWTDPTTPAELTIVRGGEAREVTAHGARLRTRVTLYPVEHWSFDRGDVQVDAWAALPDGFQTAPRGSVPLLVHVHGGPAAQFGHAFSDEFQVHAAAGFLVVGANPRGSSGRGRAWSRAIVGAWPLPDPVDLLDLRAAAEAAVAHYPQADPARIGLTGRSYGGFAVAWMVALDEGYASGIVESGIFEWGSFSGTADIGSYLDRMLLGVSFRDGAGPHHRASPLFMASRVKTPILIMHGEEDWRSPVEQSERYFSALRNAGVTTEFVRFPGEGHDLPRTGGPRHRVERLDAMLEWHARHLQAEQPADPEAAREPRAVPRMSSDSRHRS